MRKCRQFFQLSAFCVCVFLITGCSKQQDQSTAASSADILPPVDDGSQTALTEAQAETFVTGWLASITDNDVEAGARMILFDRIIDRAIASFDISEKMSNELRKGMHSGRPIQNLIGQLSQNQAGGGSYELVNSVSRGGQRHVIFRMVDPNGAMNYHDLRLLQFNGKVCSDQIFVAMTGESFADSLKSVIAPMVASQSSIVSRLSGDSKKQLAELEKQRDLVTAARTGQSARVQQLYAQLSPESQAQKLVQLGRIMASADDDEAGYLALLDQYAERFPNDPSLGLVLMDAAYLRQDSEQLQKAYDALTTWTGGDYYLTLITANAMGSFGEIDRAQKLYRSIPPEQFRTESAHDVGLGAAMAIEDFVGVLRHLRALKAEYNYEFQDLRQVEGYEGFVKSEQFEEWQND